MSKTVGWDIILPIGNWLDRKNWSEELKIYKELVTQVISLT